MPAHWEKIMALDPCATVYDLYSKCRYTVKNLEPVYLNRAKTIVNQFKDKLSGDYVDASFLRQEGEKVDLRLKEYKRI